MSRSLRNIKVILTCDPPMSSFYSTHHDRSNVSCKIEYFLDLASREIFDGIIDNISESGLCLIMAIPLKEDDVITIRDEIFLPSHTAMTLL